VATCQTKAWGGVHVEGLSPDLSRGRDKSIGGDIDIDDEGSKQNFKPL
jgi:hypothetical protein